MIGFIKGELKFLKGDTCVVLTQSGIGYEVYLPSNYLTNNLIDTGEKIELFVKTVVREDALELYGFLSEEERSMFVKLIGISKLGPKTAMAMLSHMSPPEITDAIYTEDVAHLSRVPGIGQKTAKRIILELKEKIKSKKDLVPRKNLPRSEDRTFSDALSGLINLGYREEEVYDKLKQVLDLEPDLMVEETIRKVLKEMTKLR